MTVTGVWSTPTQFLCDGTECLEEGGTTPLSYRATIPISFPLRVEPAPARTYVSKAEQDAETVPSQCEVGGVEGSAAEPLAAPGNLCVYEKEHIGTFLVTGLGAGSNAASGALLNVALEGSTVSTTYAIGSWAVTAEE